MRSTGRIGHDDWAKQIAVTGHSLSMAVFWSICDEMREETGAENLPPFLLVWIRNRR